MQQSSSTSFATTGSQSNSNNPVSTQSFSTSSNKVGPSTSSQSSSSSQSASSQTSSQSSAATNTNKYSSSHSVSNSSHSNKASSSHSSSSSTSSTSNKVGLKTQNNNRFNQFASNGNLNKPAKEVILNPVTNYFNENGNQKLFDIRFGSNAPQTQQIPLYPAFGKQNILGSINVGSNLQNNLELGLSRNQAASVNLPATTAQDQTINQGGLVQLHPSTIAFGNRINNNGAFGNVDGSTQISSSSSSSSSSSNSANGKITSSSQSSSFST